MVYKVTLSWRESITCTNPGEELSGPFMKNSKTLGLNNIQDEILELMKETDSQLMNGVVADHSLFHRHFYGLCTYKLSSKMSQFN